MIDLFKAKRNKRKKRQKSFVHKHKKKCHTFSDVLRCFSFLFKILYAYSPFLCVMFVSFFQAYLMRYTDLMFYQCGKGATIFPYSPTSKVKLIADFQFLHAFSIGPMYLSKVHLLAFKLLALAI